MTDNISKIFITYEFTSSSAKMAHTFAKEIALEQTVELPQSVIKGLPSEFSRFIEQEIIGLVHTVKRRSKNRYSAIIAYNPEITGFQIPQFLNILFGNISIKRDIRITDLFLPQQLLDRFKGPNFGISGIRDITGVKGRPFLCTALKPMGSSPKDLAKMAQGFALGCGDILKDDHGLTGYSETGSEGLNPKGLSSFKERVLRISETLSKTAQKTGKETLYFPNIIAPAPQMEEYIQFAVKQGIIGILTSPFLVSLDMIRYLSEKYSLIFMLHPALAGAYFNNVKYGIAPEILLGTIFRLIGGDISIFPNHNGRFNLSKEQCKAIAKSLTDTAFTKFPPAFPAPAGGMNLGSIPEMCSLYGEDAIFLIGGALHGYSNDLSANTALFMDEIRRHFPNSSEIKSSEINNPISFCEISNNDLPKYEIMEYLRFNDDFTWTGRDITEYKEIDTGLQDFYNIKRQEIIGRFGENTAFDLRYFEILQDGFSTLERHVHEHVIICITGRGTLIIGDKHIRLKPFDIAYVPPMKTHQLRNEDIKPFGFFCIVDHKRDRPVRIF